MSHAAPSLQVRLLGLMFGVLAVLWAAMLVLTLSDTRHELGELLDAHLAQSASMLLVQDADADGDVEAPAAPILHRYAPRAAFQVWSDGRLVLRSANAPALPFGPVAGRNGFSQFDDGYGHWRVFAASDTARRRQVYVGERQDARDEILRAVLRGISWPLALALPVLGLGMWWTVRRGLAPLRNLGRTLAARDPDALDPVPVAGMFAEMLPLATSLNDLLRRIAELLANERRFTADAAHELRTPVAAIRMQAQVARAATDDAARAHALDGLLAGCDRAARLIDQLLTLARVESAQAPGTMDVELAGLVRGVMAELAPAALAKGQHLELDAPRPYRVRGNALLLAVLVRNLVDNASRYAPQGAAIRVGLLQDGEDVALGVEDGGPGLGDAELARLGERFYRVPGSAAAGSGLGWSIVRSIAAVHGARVAVRRSERLGGLAVTVTFPGAPAP
jgi:two-component system, OmpR family, sensor histidine kinase QseC